MDQDLMATENDVAVSMVDSSLNYNLLSPEEKDKVDRLKASLDLSKSTALIEFGKNALMEVDRHSKTLLQDAKTKDVGEVGTLLTYLLTEVEKMDPAEKKEGKLIGFIRKKKKEAEDQLAVLRTQYATVEQNIDKYAEELKTHERVMLKGINFYETLADKIQKAYDEMGLNIIALLELQKEVYETIPELKQQAEETQSKESISAYRAAVNVINALDKKIYSFESGRTVNHQMKEQSIVIKEGDKALAEKLQTYVYTAVSTWRTAASIALGLEAQKQTVDLIKRGDAALDKLLRHNAEALGQNAIDITRLTEQGEYNPETLAYVNQIFAQTVLGVIKEKDEGMKRRQEGRVLISESNKATIEAILEAENYITENISYA